jgi:hypothetical protein
MGSVTDAPRPTPSPTIERTLLARNDLDWLPPGYRALRWTVAGAVWTGLAAVVGTMAAFTKFQIFIYGKAIAGLVAGGYFAGDRAARSVLRGRLRKLAGGGVDLSRLPGEADGELVHVEGRVRAVGQTLPPLLDPTGTPVVWRRVTFTLGEVRCVHEAAVDFQIVAEGSDAAIVEVSQARLLVADAKQEQFPGDSKAVRVIESLPLPASTARTMKNREKRRLKGKVPPRVRAGEFCLRDGDRIEVVGYKSRTIDPTMAMRMERETPMRATLRGGKVLPLLIAPVT